MFKGYVGIDNIARKITDGYIGIDGVARKIIKGYVGVDGLAKELKFDYNIDDFVEFSKKALNYASNDQKVSLNQLINNINTIKQWADTRQDNIYDYNFFALADKDSNNNFRLTMLKITDKTLWGAYDYNSLYANNVEKGATVYARGGGFSGGMWTGNREYNSISFYTNSRKPELRAILVCYKWLLSCTTFNSNRAI